jgi:beta-galactosidase
MKKVLSLLAALAVVLFNPRPVTAQPMAAAPTATPAAVAGGRERLLMDVGWSFHLGNDWGSGFNLSKAASSSGPAGTTFDDTGWRKVNLPHDWAVELPFDEHADMSHGYKPVGPGYPTNSVGWYRRSFALPATDAGRRLWLQFDGVYRNCDVFVNGWFVGNHASGYDGFRYDITDVANCGGNNVVAVRVDASEFEGWFYEGAGIYRHVWLEKTAPVALAPDGVFVTSKFKNNVPAGSAEIDVEASLLNTLTNIAKVTVNCEILSPDGASAAKFKQAGQVGGEGTQTVKLSARVSAPVLWSPESPKLYKLITTVEAGGQPVDRRDTEFGIRTLAFNATRGFLLNGKRYPIQGTCNHQDMAGVGAALPDALQYYRIIVLKEMGCNAYRTSHNAPTPELLEACDRVGMLVLDENRLVGGDEQNLRNLRGQIVRDRNHPSVFAWSLGNEEWGSQGTAAGAASIRTMQELAHSLDPTRLCTAAINGSYGESGYITVLDVKGFNYNLGSMDPYHKSHPNSFIIGTETASTVTTRGIYTNDLQKGYVSAYDFITKNRGGALVNPVTWGETAEEWWSFYAARPWSSGGFAWTGFDYRGEPTPYTWPCINSHFGIVDMCGFPKDNFFYYKAWWSGQPVLHVLPHWNWPDKLGQDIDVRVFSNCQEVELFLNGQSLGRQTMTNNSHLQWKVKYAPGTLMARGYNVDKEILTETVETTGPTAALKLMPFHTALRADAEDVAVIAIQGNDTQGRQVPDAGNEVTLGVSGPGKIIGVGNGDPSSHEPDQYLEQVASLPVTNWRQKAVDGTADRPEVVFDYPDASTWTAAFAGGRGGGPGRGGAGAAAQPNVYRGEFELPAIANGANVSLTVRSLGREQTVYLNGQPVAEAVSPENAGREITLGADVLRPGKNIIAIVATPAAGGRGSRGGGRGGNGNPAQIRVTTPPAGWKRSLFNGLAQVLVQSTGQPGVITVTAKSPGLSDATLTIPAEPAPLRAAVR